MSANIGERVGKLLVIGEAEPRLYGGEIRAFLLCTCECGREEEVPRKHIKRFQKGCKVCRRGKCVICGSEILRDTKSNTCSDVCKIIKNRNQWNLNYAKNVSEDPEFNKKTHLRVVEKMNGDDEFAKRVREGRCKASKRYMNNPEVKERFKLYQRQYYLENREVIDEKRRLYLLSLPRETLRKMWNAYAAKQRQKIRENPERNEKMLQKNRERNRSAYREVRRQKELANLRRTAAILTEKIGDKDE